MTGKLPLLLSVAFTALAASPPHAQAEDEPGLQGNLHLQSHLSGGEVSLNRPGLNVEAEADFGWGGKIYDVDFDASHAISRNVAFFTQTQFDREKGEEAAHYAVAGLRLHYESNGFQLALSAGLQAGENKHAMAGITGTWAAASDINMVWEFDSNANRTLGVEYRLGPHLALLANWRGRGLGQGAGLQYNF